MKYNYITFFISFLLFGTLIGHGQNRGFNYQAIIYDTNDNPLSNQSITIHFSILEGDPAMTQVYKESHTTTTNAKGLIVLSIGEGTSISGNFNAINWAIDKHFLKVDVNTGNGFSTIGTSEFKTVPYALHAASATTVSNPSLFENITANRISAINTNADFVVGSSSTEDENNVNLDSRMFFDKSKVAFRAGAVDELQWNDSNRGLYSFAGGRNTTAKGVGTTAFGKDTQALVSYSMALGDGTIANGYASLTVGVGTKSNNLGQFTNGIYNIENSDASLIVGNGTSDTERQNAFVVKSDGSIIVGANQYENDFSVTNDDSRMFYDTNKGAFRAGTTLGGFFESSYWNDSNVGFNSAAFGLNTIASGNNSSAFGIRTIASGESSTVLGRYNIDDSNALFIVGNGQPAPLGSAIRKNAFKVMRNGNVNIFNLSGSGTRNVKVNPNGDLISEASSVKYYSITPYDFEVSFADAQIRRNLLFVNILDNIAGRGITTGLHLPNGATITGYTANYLDKSSTSNLQFVLYRIASDTGNTISIINLFTTSGNVNTNRTEVITGLSETIDNQNYYYMLRVVPISGQNWDSPNTHVRSVQIQYQEN